MVDYTKRAAAKPTPASSPPPVPAPAGKISLTKASPTVSLTKAGAVTGTLRVNLNWNQLPIPATKGWRSKFGGAGQALDLDLGCLYELEDGSKGVVQALGNSFGDFNAAPYVRLDQDDRTGASTGGENLFINLAHAKSIRRLLVFAFIYEGAPSWDRAQGVVTLFPAKGPQVEVMLDDHTAGASTCAIALIQNERGELVVHREVRYVTGGHSAMDALYGWGIRWRTGRK